MKKHYTQKEIQEVIERNKRLEELSKGSPKCKKCGSIDIDVKFGVQMNCFECGHGFKND